MMGTMMPAIRQDAPVRASSQTHDISRPKRFPSRLPFCPDASALSRLQCCLDGMTDHGAGCTVLGRCETQSKREGEL